MCWKPSPKLHPGLYCFTTNIAKLIGMWNRVSMERRSKQSGCDSRRRREGRKNGWSLVDVGGFLLNFLQFACNQGRKSERFGDVLFESDAGYPYKPFVIHDMPWFIGIYKQLEADRDQWSKLSILKFNTQPWHRHQQFCCLVDVTAILLWGANCLLAEMCSERDSPLKRLYRRTHAKLTRLAGSG